MPPTSISETSMQKPVCPEVRKASWVASTMEFSGEITSQRGVSPEGKRVDFKSDYRVTKKAKLPFWPSAYLLTALWLLLKPRSLLVFFGS